MSSLNLTADDVEALREYIKEYLEDPMFEKHPHLSVLFPPKPQIGEGEEAVRETYIRPSMAGFEIKAKPESVKRKLVYKVKFIIRRAPKGVVSNELVTVNVTISIENEERGEAIIEIFEPSLNEQHKFENKLYEKKVYIEKREQGTKSVFDLNLPLDDEKCIKLFSTPEPVKARIERKEIDATYTTRLKIRIAIGSDQQSSSSDAVIIEALVMVLPPRIDTPGATIPEKKLAKIIFVDNNGLTWTYGHIMKVNMELEGYGYKLISDMFDPEKEKTAGLPGWRHLNVYAFTVSGMEHNNEAFKILLRDWAIGEEYTLSYRESSRGLRDDLADIAQLLDINDPDFIDALTEAVRTVIGKHGRLRKFQVDAAINVARQINSNRRAVVTIAPTASGKTLPKDLIALMLAYKYKKLGKKGTKVIMFYPTKALASEQTDNLVKMLYVVNKILYLEKKLLREPLTIGMYHGSVPSITELKGSEPVITRIGCPVCGRGMLTYYYEPVEDGKMEIKLKCSVPDPMTHEPILTQDCQLNTDAVYERLIRSTIIMIKEEVLVNPPDILIATPDMINYHLMLDPYSHTIIGRSLKICLNESRPHTLLSPHANVCPWHKGYVNDLPELISPIVIVIDEAHLARGVFGAQLYYLLERMKHSIRRIRGISDYKPQYILMSATIGDPDSLAMGLTGETKPIKIYAEVSKAGIPEIRRKHLFILPKAWKPMDTLVQALKVATRWFIENKKRLPKILVFVNRLSEANEVVFKLRNELIPYVSDLSKKYNLSLDLRIKGHSTDWDRERSQIEDEFSKGRIDILVATRGLEVGVNFNLIDVLTLYGAPFYISDYIQRIGRAGRTRPALILHILTDKPLDYFYFINWPIIVDQHLREQALKMEYVPIRHDNPFIKSVIAQRAVLDYISTDQNAFAYFERNMKSAKDSFSGYKRLLKVLFGENNFEKISKLIEEGEYLEAKQLNPELLDYLCQIFKKDSVEELLDDEDVVNSIEDFINNLFIPRIRSSEVYRMTQFFDHVKMAHLSDMRYAEPTVLVKITTFRTRDGKPLTRQREISMILLGATRYALTTYRGITFESSPEG